MTERRAAASTGAISSGAATPRSASTGIPSARVVIRAGRLLDVVTGEAQSDRRVLVEDGRIRAVLAPDEPGPAFEDRAVGAIDRTHATLPEPFDAPTVDLSGLTVVPGLIDAHSHLVGDMEWAGTPGLGTSAAQEAMFGVRNARVTLEAGFTTVRDVGTFRAFVDCALREAIDAGWTPGPRMQCAGAYITAPGGGGDVTGQAQDIRLPEDLRLGVVRDETDVRHAVRRLVAGGADVIKLIVTGAVLTRGTTLGAHELTEGQVRTAVETAAELGVFVAAHAHGTEGIKTAVRAGVRSIEHGSLLDDEGIELMLRHGTYLVADLYDGDWIAEQGRRDGWPPETLRKNDETTDAQREGFRRAVAAGVRVAFGTDSGVYPHGLNARQLAYDVRYGLAPLAAIRAATLWAAELMGWEDRVGSLAPGRFADLVAVAGDPLADITELERPVVVIKGGVIVRDERRAG
jgi:imidazolonepropionase-like amidohydrolase